MNDTSISIQLTGPQIDRVIRESGEGPGIASLLRGMAGDETLISRYEALAENPRLSRSLLLGLIVLASFPGEGESLAVSDIAGRLGMSPSTTHRYLTTLLSVGLLEQDARSRRYRIAAD